MNNAIHPGKYIKEKLDRCVWSQRDLAFVLGCPEQGVNRILTGNRSISPEMAKSLEDALGIPTKVLCELQGAYDLANARNPDPGIAKRACELNKIISDKQSGKIKTTEKISFLMSKKLKKFFQDVQKLCKKYDISISHEDNHGAFEFLIPYNQECMEWFKSGKISEFMESLGGKNGRE